jgi:hypothetical protein
MTTTSPSLSPHQLSSPDPKHRVLHCHRLRCWCHRDLLSPLQSPSPHLPWFSLATAPLDSTPPSSPPPLLTSPLAEPAPAPKPVPLLKPAPMIKPGPPLEPASPRPYLRRHRPSYPGICNHHNRWLRRCPRPRRH